MKILRYILIILLLSCHVDPVQSTTHRWEQVSSYPKSDEVGNDKMDVYVRDGYIYIMTPKTINVKLLSILGQLVTQQNLSAGVSRIKVPAPGIYILKAGGMTVRVMA